MPQGLLLRREGGWRRRLQLVARMCGPAELQLLVEGSRCGVLLRREVRRRLLRVAAQGLWAKMMIRGELAPKNTPGVDGWPLASVTRKPTS